MRYPYVVKVGGKWYPPNVDIPTEPETPEKTVENANTLADSQVKEVQPEKAVENAPKRRSRSAKK